MQLNLWKASTLVLAGALVIIVGRSAVEPAAACDAVVDVSDENDVRTINRLSTAFTLLDRAEDQVRAATLAQPIQRARALEHVAVAKAQVKKAIELGTTPRPRPMKKGRPSATTVDL